MFMSEKARLTGRSAAKGLTHKQSFQWCWQSSWLWRRQSAALIVVAFSTHVLFAGTAFCAVARQFRRHCGEIAYSRSPCPGSHCCCHLTRRLPGAVGTLISFDLDLFHSSGVQRACEGSVPLRSRCVFARWLSGECMCVQLQVRTVRVCCEMIVLYFYCVGFHLWLLWSFDFCLGFSSPAGWKAAPTVIFWLSGTVSIINFEAC